MAVIPGPPQAEPGIQVGLVDRRWNPGSRKGAPWNDG
jgi:hypothetical protein